MTTEEAREAAVRKFRHELEDNGGFDAGEVAMLTMSFDRAYGDGVVEGVWRAREAVWGTVAGGGSSHEYLKATVDAVAAIDALGGEQ